MNPDPLDRFADRRALFGPSPGDQLLANAQSIRLELMRYRNDDEQIAVSCSYRITGCLDVAPDAAAGLVHGIVRELGTTRKESP